MTHWEAECTLGVTFSSSETFCIVPYGIFKVLVGRMRPKGTFPDVKYRSGIFCRSGPEPEPDRASHAVALHRLILCVLLSARKRCCTWFPLPFFPFVFPLAPPACARLSRRLPIVLSPRLLSTHRTCKYSLSFSPQTFLFLCAFSVNGAARSRSWCNSTLTILPGFFLLGSFPSSKVTELNLKLRSLYS